MAVKEDLGPKIEIGKCNKKWWDSFLLMSLGLNILPGSCEQLTFTKKEDIFCEKKP